MKRLAAHTLFVALALCSAVVIAPQPAKADTNAAKKQAYIEAPLAPTGIMLMAPALEAQYTKAISLTAEAIRIVQATTQKSLTCTSPALIDTEQIAGVGANAKALMTKSYTTRHAAELNTGIYERQLAGLTNIAYHTMFTPGSATAIDGINQSGAGGNASGIQSATTNTSFTRERTKYTALDSA